MWKNILLLTSVVGLLSGGAAYAHKTIASPAATIALPGAVHGIDFDDLQFFPALNRVAVPAAQTGDLDLIDSQTNAVEVIPHVAVTTAAPHGDDRGATSASFGGGYIFTGDHGRTSIAVVDPRSKSVVARVRLAANYDYIRYVASRQEVWVTEPHQHRIEIFKFLNSAKPTLRHEAFIEVPGGPEALVIDNERGRAYTNLWSNRALAIDLSGRRIVARWPNGCRQSRGLALDGRWLFAGCKEGRAVALDVTRGGKPVSAARTGAGVDIIAYNSHLHHLYVPGSKSATLTVLSVAGNGHLQPVAVYRTVKGAHCVATDNRRKAFVCDPRHGRILVIDDHR
ncbi:MAG TPA: hypothetical protein VFM97_11550 [Gammaproteobacteria bacterium]|nr:hypothetical protein [Gammaproteobacteria bacterium]